MKTKIIFLCGLCVLTLLILSCKKNSGDDNPVVTGSLIKTMMMRYSDTVFYNYTLQYDTKNRLTQLNLTHTIGTTTVHLMVTYNYPADSITAIYIDPDDQTVIQTERYKLNGSGLAIQKDLMMNGVYASRTYYTYDDSGFLKWDSTEYESTSVYRIINNYTVNGGNISIDVRKMENFLGTTTQETDYAFVAEKANTVGNSNQGASFLGKQNANPIASATFTPSPLTGPNPLVYTYGYDTQNRIITSTTNSNVVTTYTYY